MLKKLLALVPLFVLGVVNSNFVLAASDGAALVGRSTPWQWWLQDPKTPTAEAVYDLNLMLFYVEVAIVLFVLALLIYILIKFNAKANPVPSKTTHNTLLEVIWTGVPILILILISVPSLKALYLADSTPDAEMTLKITGNQWYWSYEYPDQGGFEFDSNFVADEDLKPGQPRMLTTDNAVVLPVGTKIRLLMTSKDVIHNWAIPAFAVKLDTVPGRTNETWIEIKEAGDYYGMCSELCGINHAYMPINVKAVSKAEFAAWVVKAKVEFAAAPSDKSTAMNVAQLTQATQ